jgi:hypothetical protein
MVTLSIALLCVPVLAFCVFFGGIVALDWLVECKQLDQQIDSRRTLILSWDPDTSAYHWDPEN